MQNIIDLIKQYTVAAIVFLRSNRRLSLAILFILVLLFLLWLLNSLGIFGKDYKANQDQNLFENEGTSKILGDTDTETVDESTKNNLYAYSEQNTNSSNTDEKDEDNDSNNDDDDNDDDDDDNDSNKAPTVMYTNSDFIGKSFRYGENVTIGAIATDDDGIKELVLYVNDIKVATANAATYNFLLVKPNVGIYEVYVEATDNKGAKGRTSKQIFFVDLGDVTSNPISDLISNPISEILSFEISSVVSDVISDSISWTISEVASESISNPISNLISTFLSAPIPEPEPEPEPEVTPISFPISEIISDPLSFIIG